MKVGVLFSGGKDSALAALLLSPFAQIELVTMSFGIVPNDAASVARVLGFPHVTIGLEEGLATATINAMIKDGGGRPETPWGRRCQLAPALRLRSFTSGGMGPG